MKTAFLFSGQGSQFVGMGKDLYGNKTARNIYEKANSLISFSISKLSHEGPEEKLNQTQYTQIAIVTLQAAILEILKKNQILSSATAGLSLGEYSALYNAGALSFVELINLVAARGQIMSKVGSSIESPKMLVVLGLENNETISLVEKLQKQNHQIAVANFNCPGQQVLGGTQKAIDEFSKLATNAKRLMPIDVSVPSHTPLMEPTTIPFKAELNKVAWNELNQEFFANVTGNKTSNKQVVENLIKQLTNSTHMEKIIVNMIESGYKRFVEIGPKKVLTTFVKKIAKQLNVEVELFNATNLETTNNIIETLKEK